MRFVAAIRGWLQGKKTMLGGAVLIAAGVAGVLLGQLQVDQGAIVVGFGISVSGLAAKTDRHQKQILEALETAAKAGAAYRAGDTAAVKAAVKDAVPGVLDDIIREAKA